MKCVIYEVIKMKIVIEIMRRDYNLLNYTYNYLIKRFVIID